MDIIYLIDQAITPTCHQCGAELGDSLSNDFCGPDCQHAWHAARVDPMVGYEEPSDLPQHVHNLVEQSSPETTPSCPDDSFLMPGYIREQMGRYLRELAVHTGPPPALTRPQPVPADDGIDALRYAVSATWVPSWATDQRPWVSNLPPLPARFGSFGLTQDDVRRICQRIRNAQSVVQRPVVTDGSWEITEPRPPFRREQT